MRPTLATACALLGSMGCSVLLGDYGTAPAVRDTDSGGPAEGGSELPAFAPGLPYMAAPDCAACVDARCNDAATSCASNAECATMRACRAKCFVGGINDPSCHQTCTAASQTGYDQLFELESCVGGACESECRLGSDYSCVGAYDRPRPFEGGGFVDIRFRLPMLLSEDPAVFAARRVRVSACLSLVGACGSRETTVDVADDGTASMSLHAGPEGYEGYFFVEQTGASPADAGASSGIRPLYIDSSWPHTGDIFRYLIAEATNRSIVEGQNYAYGYDPAAAYATFVISDCTLARSRGTRIELSVPCDPPCRVGYYVNGTIDLSLTETTASPLAQAGVAYIPTEGVRVNVLDVATGRLVASHPFVFVAGASHAIELKPLSRADAAALR